MLLPNPPVFQGFAWGSLALPVPLLQVWVPLPMVQGGSSLWDRTGLLPLGTQGEKQACSWLESPGPAGGSQCRGSVGAKRCRGHGKRGRPQPAGLPAAAAPHPGTADLCDPAPDAAEQGMWQPPA